MNEKNRKIMFFIAFIVCFGILLSSNHFSRRKPRDATGAKINAKTITRQQQESIDRNARIKTAADKIKELNEKAERNNKETEFGIKKTGSAIERAESYIRENERIINDLLKWFKKRKT